MCRGSRGLTNLEAYKVTTSDRTYLWIKSIDGYRRGIREAIEGELTCQEETQEVRGHTW